jgi:hypothetical protein
MPTSHSILMTGTTKMDGMDRTDLNTHTHTHTHIRGGSAADVARMYKVYVCMCVHAHERAVRGLAHPSHSLLRCGRHGSVCLSLSLYLSVCQGGDSVLARDHDDGGGQPNPLAQKDDQQDENGRQ